MHDEGTTPTRGAEHQAAEDGITVVPAGEVPEPHGLIWKAVDALLFVGICAMLLSLAAQMVSRQMGASLPWTEELTRFLFMDTTFLGMAAGFRAAVHPRVNFARPTSQCWDADVSLPTR